MRNNITIYLASEDGKSLLYTDNDTEYALNDRDMEATAILRRADSFTILGLFLSVNPMTTVLYQSSVGDTEARMILSVLLIAMIHFANTCTLRTYLGFINKGTTPSFGPEFCSSRDEVRSRWLMKICLTTLFTLSWVETRGIGKKVSKPVGVGITYPVWLHNPPFTR